MQQAGITHPVSLTPASASSTLALVSSGAPYPSAMTSAVSYSSRHCWIRMCQLRAAADPNVTLQRRENRDSSELFPPFWILLSFSSDQSFSLALCLPDPVIPAASTLPYACTTGICPPRLLEQREESLVPRGSWQCLENLLPGALEEYPR